MRPAFYPLELHKAHSIIKGLFLRPGSTIDNPPVLRDEITHARDLLEFVDPCHISDSRKVWWNALLIRTKEIAECYDEWNLRKQHIVELYSLLDHSFSEDEVREIYCN